MGSPGGGDVIRTALRRGPKWPSVVLCAVFLLAPACVEAGAPSAALEIEPLLCDLGCLSPGDPMDSDIRAGHSRIRILSPVNWQIEILMTQIPRRADTYASPARLRHPQPSSLLPEGLFALQPCVVASGPPSGEGQEIELDWLEIGAALERVLDPLTPPGTYGALLAVRLTDLEGTSLAECMTTAVQFDVAGWVRISEEIPPVEINFEGGELAGRVFESCVTSVLMTGNTACRLNVAKLGNLTGVDGRTEIPRATVTVSVAREALGNESAATPAGTLDLDGEPVTIYAGDSSPTGDAGFLEVPVVVRLESDEPLPAGRYRMTLVFEARAQEPLP